MFKIQFVSWSKIAAVDLVRVLTISSISFDIPLNEDDNVVQAMQEHAKLCSKYINKSYNAREELDIVTEIQKETGELISSIMFKHS